MAADSVVIGVEAKVASGASGFSVVIGRGADVSAASAVAIGGNTEADLSSVAIGGGAIASGSSGVHIAIGANAKATGQQAIAIGGSAIAPFIQSIALGVNSRTTAGNQFVAGGDAHPILDVFFGDGATSSTPVEYTIAGTGGQGTDIAGGNIAFAGGRGTGLGLGGNIIFQVAERTTTGSSLNTLSTVMTITASQSVGIGTMTSTFQLHVASDSEGDIMRLEDSDGICDLNPDVGGLTTTCSSDIRLKSNIEDAPSVLAELMQLKIREYTVNASGKRAIGVIAQEVQKTHPDMVTTNSDGILMVRQPGVWELVKGIQELQNQLDDWSPRRIVMRPQR